MEQNDGGPAFPGGSLRFDDGECETPYQIGMSLRDYLAASAMQGWLATFGPEDAHPANDPDISRRVADLSYSLADAMLAARGGSDDR